MAAISVRNLDDDVAARLKVRAARHGRSMEAEVRAILLDALAPKGAGTNLAQAMRERVVDLEHLDVDDDVEIPPRRDLPRAADLPECE